MADIRLASLFSILLFLVSCREMVRESNSIRGSKDCFSFTNNTWEIVPYQKEVSDENTEYYLYSNLVNKCIDTLTIPISDYGLYVAPMIFFTFGNFGESRSITKLEYIKLPKDSSLKVRIYEERKKDILELDSLTFDFEFKINDRDTSVHILLDGAKMSMKTQEGKI